MKKFKDDIYQLYVNILKTDYITLNGDVDYYIEKIPTGEFKNNNPQYKLDIRFQWSNGTLDWINNFRFRRAAYKDMKKPFKVHAGFQDCWNKVLPHIEKDILDLNVSEILISGYSHGAAIAVLAHEYCWFNRSDIVTNIRSYAYGCPRVFGHWFMSKKLKPRWENFFIIRKQDDIVTHMPPFLFRYRHVNKILKLGSIWDENPIKAHNPDCYLRELFKFIQKEKPEIYADEIWIKNYESEYNNQKQLIEQQLTNQKFLRYILPNAFNVSIDFLNDFIDEIKEHFRNKGFRVFYLSDIRYDKVIFEHSFVFIKKSKITKFRKFNKKFIQII